MEEQLVANLLANAGLAAVVGSRIKWSVLPQGGALPAIALHMISAPRDYTMKGRNGLTGYLVQMDVWAGSYASGRTASRALVAALDNLRSSTLKRAFIENERQTFEAGAGPDAAGAANFYRTSFDVRLWASDSL